MMLEPALLAPVLCQPALPLNDPAGLEISPEDLAAVKARLDRDQLEVLAYRFAGDKFCQAQRFAAYEQALGPRFKSRVLPDSAAHFADAPPFFQTHVPFADSVVTVHLVDKDGEPTVAAREEIMGFLAGQLGRY